MPNYEVRVESEGDVALLHCDVHKWSLSTYRDLIRTVALLKKQYKKLYTCSPNRRFCEALGAYHSGATILHEGVNYEVMIWD